MNISPIIQNSIIGTNSNVQATQTRAEGIQFDQMLEEAQRNAESATQSTQKSAHIKTPEELELEAQQLRDACQQFEAMFLDLMWREMRKTVPKDELIGNSNAIDMFQEMHDTEIMKNISKAGGIGIADMMVRQLSPQNPIRYE